MLLLKVGNYGNNEWLYDNFEQVGVTPLSDIMSEFGDGGSDNNAIFLDAILDESIVVGKLFLRQCKQLVHTSRFQDEGV